MKIAFFFSREIIPNDGGVQNVTHMLTEYFKTKDISVIFYAIHKKSESVLAAKTIFLPSEVINHKENISFLRESLEKEQISILINQMGLVDESVNLCHKATQNSSLKLLTVIHSDPLFSVNCFSYQRIKSNSLKKNIVKLLLLIPYCLSKRIKTRNKLLRLHKSTDYLIFLSETYKTAFIKYLKINKTNTLFAINNPTQKVKFNACEKLNQALYVGRLTYQPKRVDLLIDAWKIIEQYIDNWELLIVGDSESKEYYIKYAKRIGVKKIKFLGHKDPAPYYRSSKIMCLTSSYEGFPMTLIESLSNGLPLIAYNSFGAVTDIIKHNENGFLVRPFKINEYASKLLKIIKDDNLQKKFSVNSKKHAENFNITKIGNKWIHLFNSIT